MALAHLRPTGRRFLGVCPVGPVKVIMPHRMVLQMVDNRRLTQIWQLRPVQLILLHRRMLQLLVDSSQMWQMGSSDCLLIYDK